MLNGPPTFHLRTFGAVSLVQVSGDSVELSRARLALLSLLATAGGRGLSRERLSGLVWPDAPTPNARHNLEQLLSALRGRLGPGAFLGTDPLRLNPDVISTDCGAFEAALRAGDWEAAVEAYAGELLDGFHPPASADLEAFLELERTRYRELVMAARERLADAASERDDHQAAVRHWRAAVVLDPYRAAAARGLMQALAASGDCPAAVRHAQIHTELLRADLDLPPDPTVVALARYLAAREARPDSSMSAAKTAAPNPELPSPLAAAGGDRPSEAAHGWTQLPARNWLVGVGAALLAALVWLLVDWGPDLAKASLTGQLAIDIETPDVRGTGEVADRLARDWGHLVATRLHDMSLPPEWLAGGEGAGTVPRLQATITTAPSAVTILARVTGGDGEPLARARASGPVPELGALIERVLVTLLLGGEESEYGRLLGGSDVAVARLHLAAVDHERQGYWDRAADNYRKAAALDADFTLALLGLRRMTRMLDHRDLPRVDSLLWERRERLAVADRSLIEALLGPSGPVALSPAEQLSRLSRHVGSYPDHAEGWLAFGWLYKDQGALLGLEYADQEAAAAFTQALAVAPSDRRAMWELVAMHVLAGDTTALDRLLGATWPDALGAAVYRAQARGDSALLALMLRAGDDLPTNHLWSIRAVALRTGRGVMAAVAAESVLFTRNLVGIERSVLDWSAYELALSMGRPNRAAGPARTMLLEWSPEARLAMRTLAAIWWDDVAPASVRLADSAARAVLPGPDGTDTDPQWGLLLCASELARLERGVLTHAAMTSRRLRAVRDVPPRWIPIQLRRCAALIEATHALRSGAPQAGKHLEALDALTGDGVADAWVLPLRWRVGRLWAESGDTTRAYRAVRRRYPRDVKYLAPILADEGAWAVAAGDTVRARSAWRHYLGLRADPEPSWLGSRDLIAGRLATLERAPAPPP